VRESKKRQFSD